MTGPEPKQTLAQLAVRDGMQQFDYFVGRTRSLNLLTGVVNQEQTTAGWVHGPRRTGKSSLVRNLISQAQEAGSAVAYLDTSGVSPTDFDGLLERLFEKLPRELRPEGSGPARGRLEQLARRSTERPILLAFDEFDNIALNLGLDEQALLRRLKEEHKRFCYLFVTRLKPTLIVEQVSEERSRLLSICISERLGMLERRDILELCRRVASGMGSASFERWHGYIWKAVGGLGAAVMTLVHALAIESLEHELDEGRVEEVLEYRREPIESILSGFWRDLQPGTREMLLDADGAKASEYKGVAKQDGFIDSAGGVIRPTWLIELGERLGSVPPESMGIPSRVAKVERLHILISALNGNVKRLSYPPVFVLTDEMLHYYLLTRPATTQDDLTSAVNHLSKILLEGSRASMGKKEWRMPPPLLEEFKKSDGYEEWSRCATSMVTIRITATRRTAPASATRTRVKSLSGTAVCATWSGPSNGDG